MENPFKKQNTELDLSNLNPILSSGVAVGVAIANYNGKNPKTAGIIGAGLSLLITCLIEAAQSESN